MVHGEESHMVGESSPVRLVQLDPLLIDGGLALDAKPGDRLWIEVTKAGQVVGVVERLADGIGIPSTVVTELQHLFSSVDPSPLGSITDDQLPRATVVVPTIYMRPAYLIRTVESILALDYPDFDVIVVDNRPGTNNAPITDFANDDQVRVVIESRPGAASARNRGIGEASGDFIAFTDDDAVVDRNFLRALGENFSRNKDVDAIGGMVRPLELDTVAQLWFEEFYGGFTRYFHGRKWSADLVGNEDPLFPYSAGHFGAGCNMAFRRTALDRFGGFDPVLGVGTKTKGGEDLKIFIEVLLGGGTVAFEPAALVRHSHRQTNRDFLSQVFDYGIGLTAMYTSLALSDRKHFRAILRRIPRGLSMLLRPSERRSPSRTTSYPRRTQLYQLLGMACGPFAYWRSLIASRNVRH